MSEKEGRQQTRKEKKKFDRLKALFGVDLCACAGGHRLKCHGVCRESHENKANGRVECQEMYHVETPLASQEKRRRPRRTWKYGDQKNNVDRSCEKSTRREKIERDRSE